MKSLKPQLFKQLLFTVKLLNTLYELNVTSPLLGKKSTNL